MATIEGSIQAGVLFVGHGTRDEQGICGFLETARGVAERLPIPVEPCFLELAEPTIETGIGRLAEVGVRRVIVMPLLLFAAGHAKTDIPLEVKRAATKLGITNVEMASHLGCHRSLLELSSQRYYEAVAEHNPVSASDTALLMVGRGSTDAAATAEMHRFVQSRLKLTPVGRAETCFLAMASPSFEQALAKIATGGINRIVVQPHLLFNGELLRRMRDDVADAAKKYCHSQWIVARQLGASPPLIDAICDRLADVEHP